MKRFVLQLIIYLALIIGCHVFGPTAAEAPEPTDNEKLSLRVRELERYALWWVRAGRPSLINPNDFEEEDR